MTTIAEIQSLEEANPKIIRRSEIEGAVIRGFAKQCGLTTYIDFGCWVGLLAQQALKDGDFERAILVDAVGACLSKTAAKVNPGVAAQYHQVAVVADPDSRSFQVPVQDTSCAGFGQPGLTIDVSQVEVGWFLRSLNVDLSRTYLKIDLEGLDLRIATRLHRIGQLPRVLHIEFTTDAQFQYLFSLLNDRYAFPVRKSGHMFYSMALSKERGVLIGFDPDCAYS